MGVVYKKERGLEMRRMIRKLMPVTVAVILLNTQQLLAFDEGHISNLIQEKQNNIFESTVNQNKQQMYLTTDTNILSDNSSVSSVVERDLMGTSVYVIGIQGQMCQVLTEVGRTGYVSVTYLTDDSINVFHDEDTTRYTTDGAEVRTSPSSDNVINTLAENTEVHVTGQNDEGISRVEIDGVTYYINSDSLSDTKIYTPVVYQVPEAVYSGNVLTPSSGTVMGPSGKETYYNLNMSICVLNAQNAGATGEYWVREDGVKMLGGYVMVAANFSIHPLASLVPTSLGMGIVVDTGGFALNNPTQLDIAVTW